MRLFLTMEGIYLDLSGLVLQVLLHYRTES